MPKIGMEPIRRSELVDATIAELASKGSMDITVGQIAKRAGMSTALAHHYFGGKDQIFLAAMRQILRDFGVEVRRGLTGATHPKARAVAVIEASFSPTCFSPDTVSAWMTLYAQAQTNREMLRLLRLYQRRLKSNLSHALRPLADRPEAIAETLAALIDGLYLRAALSRSQTPDAARTTALDTLNILLESRR
ncbi:HTH-type transcriptional regulator BetI [Roseobacter fucihabitans]|uniref:HTH-type transcriptional regulator BetI n=1 Tax=Roseobacter fucihabitans TaxID=1537242 RepID=A0ABZ2BVL9_9RHOB|nr:transcriptional regulator BetI [Roseobacter litoralis]MBC6964849.1 HTH-type transcriptional regulator BetI [Roseobacter litoralis]